MTKKIFNSPFEMQLRLLLLLSSRPEATYTVDRMVALDFISCYAADFSLPFGNLHGQNNHKFAEMSNRRMLVQLAINEAFTKGLVDAIVDKGYFFTISTQGLNFIQCLEDAYAVEYSKIVKATIKKYNEDSDKDIIAAIQSDSLRSLRR